MVEKYKVPENTGLRFVTEERIRGISNSMRRNGNENLSGWIREAIDMRILLERRGYDIEFIMSGDFLQSLELLNSNSEARASQDSSGVGPSINPEQYELLIKLLLRTHGYSKQVLKIVGENPNINTTGESYERSISDTQKLANDYYDRIFRTKDE
ncbi:hypothetical protein [Vibrio vulnificus]|uniref:hypothetical protein n=1 Tax=Vibrio vulnificus TaxID=672 RepID=UPI00102332B0|nr:hypothetical protein [Vibrio vulnificus]